MQIKQRKLPKQSRSKEKVERILKASKQILSQNGLGGFTTNSVAEACGVTVGSIYQYFPNKEAIIIALYEEWLYDVQQSFLNYSEKEKDEKNHVTFYVGFAQTIYDDLYNQNHLLYRQLHIAFLANKKLAQLEVMHEEKMLNQIVAINQQFTSLKSSIEHQRLKFIFQTILNMIQMASDAPKNNRKQFINYSLISIESILKSL